MVCSYKKMRFVFVFVSLTLQNDAVKFSHMSFTEHFFKSQFVLLILSSFSVFFLKNTS